MGDFRFNVRRRRLAPTRTKLKSTSSPPESPQDGTAPAAAEPLGISARGLVNSLPCGAMILDAERRIGAINDRLCRLVGLDNSFLRIGEPFADFARRASLSGEAGLLAIGDLIPADGEGPDHAETLIHTAARTPLEARACRVGTDNVLITVSPPLVEGTHTETDITRNILNNLPGAVMRLAVGPDRAVAIVYASPRSYELLGRTEQAVLNDANDFRGMIVPDDVAVFDSAIDAVLPGGGPIDTTFHIRHPDRNACWVRSVGMVTRFAAGEIVVDVRLIDIEERMRVVEEREHFSMLLDNIVENIPMMINVRDAETGRIVFVNQVFADSVGQTRESLIGTKGTNFFETAIEAERERGRRRLVETGQPVTFPESTLSPPGQPPQIIQTTIYPMAGDDGAVRYILTISEAMTERRAAEAALQRSQLRLREAIESFSDGLALYDSDDRLVLCNRRYADMWPGVEEITLPGTPYEAIVRAFAETLDLGDRIEPFVQSRLNWHRNPPSSREVELPDGRWVQINDRATADGGVVVTCADITALKEREEGLRKVGQEALRAKEAAETANRSKSNFLANMSHELRTPLNAVIGFSEIIKNAMLGDEAIDHYKGYARDIHDSGRHLLALINDILDMSKIEAGKLDLFEEEVDIRTVIEAAFRLVRERAEKTGIALAEEIPDDLPRLRADMRKVKQILINLVGNAVKFTRRAGTVTVAAMIDADGRYCLEVRDTGIGIRKEDLDSVLAPFGQADAGLNRRYEGSGLGLTLTKALTELHGGTLALESRHGVADSGTTVRLTFPAERVIRA